MARRLIDPRFIPPQDIPIARDRATLLRLCRSSCRPSGLGRPSGTVLVEYRLHGRWSVAPAVRRYQQARGSVPWVTPQPMAHVQPVQLVRALGGGPSPHTMGLHHMHRTAPPRPAHASRSVPIAGGEIEVTLLCAGGQGTLPAAGGVRCARCARRDRSGASPGSSEPPQTARLTRCVPLRSQVVRSSWPCCVPRGRACCRLRAGRAASVVLAELPGCHPGPSHAPALAFAAALWIYTSACAPPP